MDREKYTEKKSTEFIENPYKGYATDMNKCNIKFIIVSLAYVE